MFTFGKEERLRSKKNIDRLFAEGHSFYIPPFRVMWLDEPFDTGLPARILIGVPKRKVKKAVHRNRLKRIIREAYRLNKNPFYQFLLNRDSFCTLAVIYNAPTVVEFTDIEEKIILVLKRLQMEYEKADR